MQQEWQDAEGETHAGIAGGRAQLQFAETISLTRETVYRAVRMEAPKSQERTTEMLEIVGRIVDWAGDEQQAMA